MKRCARCAGPRLENHLQRRWGGRPANSVEVGKMSSRQGRKCILVSRGVGNQETRIWEEQKEHARSTGQPGSAWTVPYLGVRERKKRASE